MTHDTGAGRARDRDHRHRRERKKMMRIGNLVQRRAYMDAVLREVARSDRAGAAAPEAATAIGPEEEQALAAPPAVPRPRATASRAAV